MTEYKYSGVVMYNKRLTSLTTKRVSKIMKKVEREESTLLDALGFRATACDRQQV